MSRLLIAGVAAGPVFIGAGLVQAATREGFDLRRHPLSLLALGEHGWIQIAVFVITGLLLVLAAIGLARTAGGQARPHRSAPALVAAMGVGLILSGVFTADPGAGFPAGAPAGAPELSWHGVLHEVGFGLTGLAWLALTLGAVVRFGRLRRRGRLAGFLMILVGGLLVPAWPDPSSLTIRLVVASAFWLAVPALLCLARRVRSGRRPTSAVPTGSGQRGLPARHAT